MKRAIMVFVSGVFVLFVGANILARPAIWYGTLDKLPGSERHDLEGLDPHFRAKVEPLIDALAKKGYSTYVRAGLRDQMRQDYWLKKGYSRTRASKHLTGQAVDLLYDGSLLNLPAHVRYFRLLEREAKVVGLCPGAAWSHSNWLWSQFDLGWDPAHVEMCARKTP